MRIEDLRFASSEVGAFVQAMGLRLSGEAAGLLVQSTEGWITGIQLLALVLRGHSDAAEYLRSFHGTHRFLLDYVIEEFVPVVACDKGRSSCLVPLLTMFLVVTILVTGGAKTHERK